MKQPAFMFYTGDWLKDPKLSMCSPATRGIFLDAICAMHESDRSGLIEGTLEQLARVLRATPSEVTSALAELESTDAACIRKCNGVFKIINRRMQREQRARLATKERVAKHRGNGGVTPVETGVQREGNNPSSSSLSASASPKPPEGAGGGEKKLRISGKERRERKLNDGFETAKARLQ